MKKIGNPNIGDTKNQGMTNVVNVEDSIKAGNTQGRTVVGSGGPGMSAPSADTGKNFVQAHGRAVGGPGSDGAPIAANKSGTLLNDPAGAKYRTQVTYGYAPAISDSAKLTQANGNTLPPAIDRGRSHGGFQSGEAGPYESRFAAKTPAPGWVPPNRGVTS